jgi:hypothetical protein
MSTTLEALDCRLDGMLNLLRTLWIVDVKPLILLKPDNEGKHAVNKPIAASV